MREINTFADMKLKPELMRAIEAKGYEVPTPIQIHSVPVALAGRDVIGQAHTGTGKTAAFALPILHQIARGRGLQALVLCPTRELAVQVTSEFESLGKFLHIACQPIYGGQSIEVQLRGLMRTPEVIVATPGRLLDHLRRRTVTLSGLRFVVLDEADEMLDMGFLPDIEKVMGLCPTSRQTFLFSATLEEEIKQLALDFMDEPEIIRIESPELTVPLINQEYYLVNAYQKVETVCRIIDVEQPPVCLIFCRTKRGADNLARLLDGRGYPAESLHGDLSQRERDTVMERFRGGNIRILVATDLAARGLDVDIITHVLNYDIPEDADVYVHRIGRTGRAGRDGKAITLVEKNQVRQLRFIEKHIGKTIERQTLPSLEDVLEKRRDDFYARVLENCAEEQTEYEELAFRLLDEQPPEILISTLISMLMAEQPELETAELDDTDNGLTNIDVPLGRRHGVNPRRLVDFITANTSLKPKQVGDIEIHSGNTLVEIPIAAVDEVDSLFDQNVLKKWKSGGQPGREEKKNTPNRLRGKNGSYGKNGEYGASQRREKHNDRSRDRKNDGSRRGKNNEHGYRKNDWK